MALNISWEIEGERQLSRRLRGIGDQMEDWTEAFKETADHLEDTFRNDVFDTEGRAIGEKWEPLSPAYRAWKEQNYPGKGILERTGTMRSNFDSVHKKDMAMIWNDTPYFKYHQSNKSRRGNLPRRPAMKLYHRQREDVQKIFLTYFRDKMKG